MKNFETHLSVCLQYLLNEYRESYNDYEYLKFPTCWYCWTILEEISCHIKSYQILERLSRVLLLHSHLKNPKYYNGNSIGNLNFTFCFAVNHVEMDQLAVIRFKFYFCICAWFRWDPIDFSRRTNSLTCIASHVINACCTRTYVYIWLQAFIEIVTSDTGIGINTFKIVWT